MQNKVTPKNIFGKLQDFVWIGHVRVQARLITTWRGVKSVQEINNIMKSIFTVSLQTYRDGSETLLSFENFVHRAVRDAMSNEVMMVSLI